MSSILLWQLATFMAKTSEDMGDTMIKLIDKLAGKGSDIKLSFQDLTLDVGGIKTKLNGSVVLDVLYVKEKDASKE